MIGPLCLMDQEERWCCTSCQLIWNIWLVQSPHCLTSCSDHLHFLLLHAASCADLSPPVSSCSSFLYDQCLRWHLWHSASCIFHISTIQYVWDFVLYTPWGYFHVLHSESHTVWIHLGNTLWHVSDKYNCIFICCKKLSWIIYEKSYALTSIADTDCSWECATVCPFHYQ